MRSTRSATIGRVALLLLIVAALIAASPPQAGAVGAEIYRVDRRGERTATTVRWGGTGPGCCCTGASLGNIGWGARVCYLP